MLVVLNHRLGRSLALGTYRVTVDLTSNRTAIVQPSETAQHPWTFVGLASSRCVQPLRRALGAARAGTIEPNRVLHHEILFWLDIVVGFRRISISARGDPQQTVIAHRFPSRVRLPHNDSNALMS